MQSEFLPQPLSSYTELGDCSVTSLCTDSCNEPAPSLLLVEGVVLPLNIHNPTPRFSWRANVAIQSHYQLQIGLDPQDFESDSSLIWDSGKVASNRSRNVCYQGRPLPAGKRLFWRVRVWDASKTVASQWSSVEYFEYGLSNRSDWQARWITAEPYVAPNQFALSSWIELVSHIETEDGQHEAPAKQALKNKRSATLFRREFRLSKEVLRAKLYSTAAGYYEIFVNGDKVSKRIMDPGQTDFDKRILYNSDDISEWLQSGDNAIAIHLGSGWYDEGIAFSHWQNPDDLQSNQQSHGYSYGQPSLIVQLKLEYQDGTSETIVSDEQWLCRPSAVLKEGIFSGEFFDASASLPSWNEATPMDQHGWSQATCLVQWPTIALEPQLQPPVQAVREIRPIALFQPKAGVWVFDFGQNFTGIPTLNLALLDLVPKQTLYLRYAEWADAEGNISQLSMGGWATHLNAVDGYRAGGASIRDWTPSFSWHGFRYIEVTGLTKRPALEALSAQLIRSSVRRVGHFDCSDKRLNRIHDTALWTYESNLIGVPLDCPNREKAGWTGDAHASLNTANFNFDMETFWRKYLIDFQTTEYLAPIVVPGKRTGGEKIDWAVAEVFIAWEHYRHYGDIQVLENQYQNLDEFMSYAHSQLQDNIVNQGFGDWCDPVSYPGESRSGGRGVSQWTAVEITSTALLVKAASSMSQIAKVLGKHAESVLYRQLFTRTSSSFHHKYYSAELQNYGSQTATAMALAFDITPVGFRQAVAEALSRDITDNWQGHSSVGALGQSWLYLALSDYGHQDVALNIFKANGFPGFSYLFDELNGTTLWERKCDYDPNGVRGPVRSLNHPFHSGYDAWFYQGLGGIRLSDNSVSFQEFILRPVFPQSLEYVDVSLECPHGEIVSRWTRQERKIIWEVTIPQNTHAQVILPSQPAQRFAAGSYIFDIALDRTHAALCYEGCNEL
ncbi:glycoside hydrolase family 78 protein [Photobacterium sp. ZSDE20]|uniref:alpha-L-rhamnosidase n=1 Tax=Photobacterium pectinilyticum TaxID=2906793 RepID=A0ABT1N8W0_9GAMM|nr:family 78 glycoside hydrolase catalytic domain [Photobacterium sp. ZSDE20]MCQ1061190.1 glycoside hydrolase family 78 protein [Photobacterium sp. ZSDE20]MDD1829546.1 glycoside hydrolase family 78 protein [Photobacterium sp. ZSDE20]